MNIVYLGPFRFPIFDAAAARVLNNAKCMQSIGHNVFVVSWGGSYLPEDKISDNYYQHENVQYVITNELDEKGPVLKRFVCKYKRGNKTLHELSKLGKVDVIVMYNARHRLSKIMLKYCNANNIKLVHDMTEWFDSSDMHLDDYLPNFINMHFLQKRIKNKICISTYLDRYYSNSHNIVIPATCDTYSEKWFREIDVENTIPKFDGITLIYAGCPAKKDCVHTVINVVNKLSVDFKIRLVILGITKDDYVKKYFSLLKTTNLNENILFLGKVSQDVIPQYYKQADFMILIRKPTRKCNAGFPTKFAESFISGTPVISNATSDIPKYLFDGKNGFLVEGYTEQEVEKALLQKILPLKRNEIQILKENTLISRCAFDFRNYTDLMQSFMNSLK